MYLQLDTRHENLDMLGTAIVHSAFDPCILWKYFVFYRNICKQIKNISVTTYCNSARHVWCPFRFDPHLVSEGWPHLLMMKFWTTISPHSLHWLGLAGGTTSKNVLPPPRLHADEDDGCKILCHRILPKTAEAGVPMHSLFWLTSPHSGNVELDHARLSRDLAAVAQFHSNSVS